MSPSSSSWPTKPEPSSRYSTVLVKVAVWKRMRVPALLAWRVTEDTAP